jgi:O-antigen ligase
MTPRARTPPPLDELVVAALFLVSFMPFVGFLGPLERLATIFRWPLLGFAVGWFCWRTLFTRTAVDWRLTRVQAAILAYLGVVGLSTVLSPTPRVAMMKYVALVMVIGLVHGLLVMRLTAAAWRRLLLGIGLLLTGLTLPSLFVGESISSDYHRTRGFLGTGPNATGLVGIMGLGLVLPYAGQAWVMGRRHRALMILAAAAGIFGVLLATGSRSSVAGAVGVGAAWFWALGGRGGVKLRLALFLVAAFGMLVASQLAFARQQTAYLLRERGVGLTAFASRAEIWTGAVEGWRKRPLLGYGYSSSGIAEEVSGVATQAFTVRDGSGYFGLLESVGVLGVAAFAAVMLSLAPSARRLRRLPLDDPNRTAGTCALACLGGLAVNHVGEPWLLGPGSPIQLVFWLCTAAIVALASQPPLGHQIASRDTDHPATARIPGAVARRLERNRMLEEQRREARRHPRAAAGPQERAARP